MASNLSRRNLEMDNGESRSHKSLCYACESRCISPACKTRFPQDYSSNTIRDLDNILTWSLKILK